jgi:hypothetical protein
MTTVAFVLLLFMNGTELKEYTVRDGMSECLKAKRMASRQLTATNRSTRYACKKLKIKLDEDNNIIEILE